MCRNRLHFFQGLETDRQHMAAINQEAIQELNLVLELLMPEGLPSGIQAVTSLSIHSASPTGLGGFLEPNPNGTAYIHGLRLSARFGVILQGSNLAGLRASTDAVAQAFMGADKTTLRNNGILKIVQTGSDYQRLSGAEREFRVSFDLVYEYRRVPEDIEDIIEDIPINMTLDTGDG
jgi:hypothetical protein